MEIKEYLTGISNDIKLKTICNNLSKISNLQYAPINDDTFIAIGKVIVSFQRLEFFIKSFVKLLSGIDNFESYIIFINKMSFKDLKNIMLTLAQHKKIKNVEAIEVIHKAIGSYIEPLRNDIVHSVWSRGIRIKPKVSLKTLNWTNDLYDTYDLEQMSNQIDNIANAISVISSQYENSKAD